MSSREGNFNSVDLDLSSSDHLSSNIDIEINGKPSTSINQTYLSDSFSKTLKHSQTLDINANILPRISTPKPSRARAIEKSSEQQQQSANEAPKILVFDCNNKPVEPNEKTANEKADSENADAAIINKYLPQSKFGLGSDHADMILIAIRYIRIVFMVYVVWLIGKS